MLDNVKFQTSDKNIINKMLLHSDFKPVISRVNSVQKYKHKTIGSKLRFNLHKEFCNSQFVGYKSLYINISPHYHFNQYRHNGNDFNAENCIRTLKDILKYLKIELNESNKLKVCNIEFGVNLIPDFDVKCLINSVSFYNKTPFITPDIDKSPYYKISDTTDEKRIKVYAKGIHCHDLLNAPEIDYNTFRFEVKSLKSRTIGSFFYKEKISVFDLLDFDSYKILSQILKKEWLRVLVISPNPDISSLKSNDVQFIKNTKEMSFWEGIIKEKHRNTFGANKKRYYKLLSRENNLHDQITYLLNDKLLQLSQCAFSPQKLLINKGKSKTIENTSKLIKGENAHSVNCNVVELDIPVQKKRSHYLLSQVLDFFIKTIPTFMMR